MIDLYHSAGTRSLRCLWALEELGVAYQLHSLPFPPRLKAPEFLQINPAGTLPFMVDGDTRMSESGAILQYLDCRYGEGELSVAPASAEFGNFLEFLHFGEASLAMPQSVVLRYQYFMPKELRQPAVAKDYQEMVLGRLPRLEQQLAGRDYLCGEFSLADISVGYALILGETFGVSEHYPEGVKAYLSRLKERAALQRALEKK